MFITAASIFRAVRRFALLASALAVQVAAVAQINDLCNAVSNDDAAAVQSAINAGADVNAWDVNACSIPFETPLGWVASTGAVNAARVLLDNGANVNIKDTNGETPLFRAMHSGSGPSHRGVVELLIVRGADIHAKDKYGATPLHRAALNESNGIAEALLLNGARVNERDNDGGEPLHHAALVNAVTVAMLLINHGANVNAKAGGETLLDIAREKGFAEMETFLLARGGRPGSEIGGNGGGGGGSSGLAIGLGAAALIGIGIYALNSDDEEESAFSIRPLMDYESDNGAESFHYGMRLDYRRDAWQLWWTADDSRLGWGGEWRGEWLRARADVWETGRSTDLRADLGMEWKTRGWRVRPSWRLRADSDLSGKWRWNSGADLSAEWSRAGWTIRPSIRALDLRHPGRADLRLCLGWEF